MLKYLDVFDKISSKVETKGHQSESIIRAFHFECLIVFIISLYLTIKPKYSSDLLINSFSSLEEMVNISLTIEISMPCTNLRLDVVDELGLQLYDIKDTVSFKRVASNGSIIGVTNRSIDSNCLPCYGLLPPDQCCNTCEQLRQLASINHQPARPDQWIQCQNSLANRNEKCLLKGKLSLNKAAGQFRIISEKNTQNAIFISLQELFEPKPSDLSHKILRFRIGNKIPTINSPLVGKQAFQIQSVPFCHTYSLLATPVIYFKGKEYQSLGYSYQVLSSLYPAFPPFVPSGIFFNYQFAPYTVKLESANISLTVIFSSTFGAISGIYAIAYIFGVFRFRKSSRIIV